MSQNVTMRPIGTVKSVFHFKNGTPRQSSLCESARGILTIEKSVFNNPEHSLEGLEEFSHAWMLFIFHKNNNAHTKAKVKPPRLDGQRVGVFSSRSPYRPNNIGLSLVKIDKVEGASVHVSGIDILDGTPVLDIKPYIPEYDRPKEDKHHSESLVTCNQRVSAVNDSSNIRCNAENKDTSSSVCSVQITHATHVKKEPDTDLSKAESNFSKENDTSVTDVKRLETDLDKNLALVDPLVTETGSGCHKNASSSIDQSEGNLHPVAEGFYALSAALERAGQKLVGTACKSESSDLDKDMDLPCAGNASRDFDFGSLLGCGCEGGEGYADDDDVDMLVGDILAKAAFDISAGDASLNMLSGTSHTTELSPKHDKAGVTQLSSTYSSSKKKKGRGSKESLRTNTKQPNKGEEIPATVASWLLKPPVSKLSVTFTSQALEQLDKFSKESPDPNYRLQMLSSAKEAKKSIADILQEEPRSVYRRQHCQDSLYYFAVDVLHVTCWFDEDVAQVVRVKPVALVTKLQLKDMTREPQ